MGDEADAAVAARVDAPVAGDGGVGLVAADRVGLEPHRVADAHHGQPRAVQLGPLVARAVVRGDEQTGDVARPDLAREPRERRRAEVEAFQAIARVARGGDRAAPVAVELAKGVETLRRRPAVHPGQLGGDPARPRGATVAGERAEHGVRPVAEEGGGRVDLFAGGRRDARVTAQRERHRGLVESEMRGDVAHGDAG